MQRLFVRYLVPVLMTAALVALSRPALAAAMQPAASPGQPAATAGGEANLVAHGG